MICLDHWKQSSGHVGLAMAQGIKSLAASTHVLSCVQEVRCSMAEADELDSGFRPFGVGKIWSI